MEPADIFRNNTYQLIKKRRLVQSHIAEAIGEEAQSLNGYLRGRINWGETKRKKLASYLGVDYYQLYNQDFEADAVTTIGIDEKAGVKPIKAAKKAASDIDRVIRKFKNQKRALEINQKLLKLESIDPDQLDDILRVIDEKIRTLELFLKKSQKVTDQTHPEKKGTG